MAVTRAIMVLGTSSNVGKSWLVTGLCALLHRWGFSVAPFKALGISSNTAPARSPAGEWGEIGRAQATQAEACGLAPDVDMNPLLIKPVGPGRFHRLLLGQRVDPACSLSMEALWADVTAAYRRTAAHRDFVVVEGSGSPVELNLLDQDLANGRLARFAAEQARNTGGDAACLLVGDIERGGVFASLVGTLSLMPPDLRALVKGLVVNRYRGDPEHFAGGAALLEQHTGLPVRGVIPWRPELRLDPEEIDIGGIDGQGPLDVCVLRVPALTDFESLAALGNLGPLRVRFVARAERVGTPDLIVLPNAGDAFAALEWLRRRGLDRVVRAAADREVPVLGLCSGYQVLGRTLVEQNGAGSTVRTADGLGLLPVDSVLEARRQVRPTSGRTAGGWLLPAGLEVAGYRVIDASSAHDGPSLLSLDDADGCVAGSVAGTDLHGFLDSAAVRNSLVDALLQRRGLPPWQEQLPGAQGQRARRYEQLADLLESSLDLDGLLG